METKPYSIQSPEQIAKDYGGNKQKIAQAMQTGIIDPTAGTLAGMFIDRMRSAQMQEQAPQQTVAQQVFAPPAPPPAPMGGPQMPPQGGPAPAGPPSGLGATPEAAQMAPPPPPQGAPMGMAEGGLTTLPIPDTMFDEPNNGGYADGGIIAFNEGGMSSLYGNVEQVESRGNQNAVSPKGARGVMQLMPGTIRDPGFGVKTVRELMQTGLSEEEANRKSGQQYLDAMYRRYGNKTHALMAYNWGPGKMDKWLASGADPKQIPSETLDYVKKVTGSPIQTGAASGAAPAASSGDDLTSYFPKAYNEGLSFYDKNMPKAKTEARDMLRAEALKGIDPETLKKQAKEDKWATLAQIGFNMAASNSPHFLQAVGAAAAAALPGARADKKEREAQRREALRTYAELEGLDNQEAREQVNFGLSFANTKLGLKKDDLARKLSRETTAAELASRVTTTEMQVAGQQKVAEINRDSFVQTEERKNEGLMLKASGDVAKAVDTALAGAEGTVKQPLLYNMTYQGALQVNPTLAKKYRERLIREGIKNYTSGFGMGDAGDAGGTSQLPPGFKLD